MFTTSIKYFDELYYLNNMEILSDGDAWHSSHSNWMSIYSKLSMPDFIQRLQDYAFFEAGFNTLEVDIYCQELFNQVNYQKQEIEDKISDERNIKEYQDPFKGVGVKGSWPI